MNRLNPITTIALIRGPEQYVLMFRDRAEALRALGRWASNPELSFTWYDAAVMAGRVGEDIPILRRIPG